MVSFYDRTTNKTNVVVTVIHVSFQRNSHSTNRAKGPRYVTASLSAKDESATAKACMMVIGAL